MMNVMKIQLSSLAKLVLAVVTLMLTACSTVVPVSVTTFHDFPVPTKQIAQDPPLKRYVFLQEKLFNNDLEMREFARIIAEALAKEGFVQASPAEFGLTFATGAPKSTVQSTAPVMNPFVTCFGWSGGAFCNPVGGAYTQVFYDIYRNTLELNLTDLKTDKRVWQATAVSDSSEVPNLIGLMPLLAKGAVRNFPGESGKVVKYDFEVTKKKSPN